MWSWAISLLLVAIVAAFIGFSDVSSLFAGIAKIIFFMALVLFLFVLIFKAMKGENRY